MIAGRLLSLRALTAVAIVALIVSLGWAYAAIFQAPASGMYHDDGIYLVTARALAEGEGYRIISLPDAPVQTKYPILFPFLLSLVWRAVPSFPDNLLWLRTIPLAAMMAWLYLLWQLFRRCGTSSTTALMIVALTAVSPAVAYFGNTLMAETLFAALLTGSLLSLTVARDGGLDHWRWCALAGVLAGASVLTRTPGVAVIVAGLGWLLTRRRWADACSFAAGAAVLVAPWVWWVATQVSPATESYYSASVYGAGGAWNIVFSHSWQEKFIVLRRNIEYATLTPVMLWGQRNWLLIPCLLALPLLLRGLWLNRANPVAWCVIVYLGIVLAWVWPPSRLLVPVTPLIVWLVSDALRPIARTAAAIAAVVLTVSSLAALFQMAAEAPVRVIGWPSQAGHPEGWLRLEALYNWIRRATPNDAVLVGDLDPTYFLYTGRKAVRAFDPDGYSSYYDTATQPGTAERADMFRRRVLEAGADFWVWSEGPNDASTHARLRDALSRTYPDSVSIAIGDPESGYAVYRVNRARLERPDQRR